ncbi:GGDEF domain-containing protein [Thermodesulforhabdus norvegica]|uniref:PAS domain S-box-containing protein/diguanylate cyclase (GGDEF) domain-containing protein n=1 Tax=Thermodesulforhabdus norvegica TaxID=39841 RepID=A0A1I4QJ70_9BACT|nr:sensor domain-containing diguanylate cyclase [Thermodesulforhabdus norvegica]SFM39806.1 PAS domain S-box-containing protein/diguanylate cyclase (GGDEF) domain-containing protein [Thermodesulforhabdus norvegica]
MEGSYFAHLDSWPLPIVVIGKNKLIRWANREALRLFRPQGLVEKGCQGYLCDLNPCPLIDGKESKHLSQRWIEINEGKGISCVATAWEERISGESLVFEVLQPLNQADICQGYFEALFENMEAMALLLDSNLRILRVNRAFSEQTGYSQEELLGKQATVIIHPEEISAVLKRHSMRLRGEPIPISHAIRFLTKDGRVRRGISSAVLVPETQQTLVTVIDVTEARETRELLEKIFLSAPIAIYISQGSHFKMVNPEMVLATGYSEVELLKMHPLDLVHPEDRERVSRAAREMLEGRRSEPYEYRALRKDGAHFWYLGTVTSITYQGELAVLGYNVNIHGLKELQNRLQRKKAQLEAIIENAPLIVLGLKPDGEIVLFNRYSERLTGFKRDEVFGKKAVEFFIPEEFRNQAEELLLRIAHFRSETHEAEIPVLTRNGRRFIHFYGALITGGDKSPMILIIGDDVTEKKLSYEQRQMMLEAIPNPAWLISKERKIVAQNRAAREIFRTEEGRYCWEAIWNLRFITEEQRRHYLETGRPLPETRCIFCESDKALGKKEKISKELESDGTIWETWWIMVAENLYVHYASDITRYKRMQQELYRLSITDPLTGAYNRRYFEKKLDEEIERAKRTGMTFSVVMFDIDHFKSINDLFGHEAGDMVLQVLVKTVKDRIRKTDLLARWGGEEFVLLLPATPVDNAIVLAEDLRQRIERLGVHKVREFTVSFGATEYRPGDTPDSIISRADEALYAAKREGRNRVKAVR